jgi:hypothetical protein
MVTQDVRSKIRSYKMFETKDPGVGITRIEHITGAEYDLELGASNAISSVVKSFDMINVEKSIQSLRVSGFDARRYSMTADVKGDKCALEGLIIYDPNPGFVWLVTFFMCKDRPLNPFKDFNLNAERAEASKALNSISIRD